MCGIIGYIGNAQATPILLESLKKLEYRGYDSAGIAIGNSLKVYKKNGRITDLETIIPSNIQSNIGIGHTRWATHGTPTTENAHPHLSQNKTIAVVHNGIIENYQKLKKELIEKGYQFKSETDTEVIGNLIEYFYDGNLLDAVKQALSKIKGSYALSVMASVPYNCNEMVENDIIVVAKKDSPLVIGIGENEHYISSDVTAILKYTKKVIYMQDYELAIVRKNDIEIIDFEGNAITRKPELIKWDIEASEKAGYEHFMLKEIHEQPNAIKESFAGRISELDGNIHLDNIGLTEREILLLKRIVIVACGTSYHAGLFGKYILEKQNRILTEVAIGSEFRYSNPILSPDTLIIAITQSGETADTLAAIKEAKIYGCPTIAITNVVGSSITRDVDGVIYTHAGPEIGVAATKTFITQLIALKIITMHIGKIRKTLTTIDLKQHIRHMKGIPSKIQEILDDFENIKECAKEFIDTKNYFFIGRGINCPIAYEGALKLKEISYMSAEGYPAGELKHGPLALLTEESTALALVTHGITYDKMLSNIKEIKARDASVIAVAEEGDKEISKYVDRVIFIPQVNEFFAPILLTVVVQLFSYYVAKEMGCEIDKPRNLAKSVTVE